MTLWRRYGKQSVAQSLFYLHWQLYSAPATSLAAVVEDDTAYYIVMCRDIKERMTEDDLWTETQQNTVISQAYSDAFEDMLDGWTGEQKVEKNDSAIKKYDAFKIDMDSSSQSA